MTAQETEPESRKKFDTGLLVGLIAIAISVASLLVYIYQARIMQSQLHTAVWPRVEWVHSNTDGTYIEVINKGIGPAIIKNYKMKLDNQEIENLPELFNKLLGPESESLNCGRSPDCITSYIYGRVMAPGEAFRPFIINDSLYARKLDSAFHSSKFEMEICYCSIYEDCWTSKGLEVIDGSCN